MIHNLAIHFMARPFLWATMRRKQNFVTKTIRRIWRAL